MLSYNYIVGIINSYRLRQAVEINDEKPISKNPKVSDDEAYKNYISCIKQHVDAIKLVFLLTQILNIGIQKFWNQEI